MRTPTLLQLAAYGIYLPTFAVSPKLAKETVYMPSQVAAQVLGAKQIVKADEQNVNRET